MSFLALVGCQTGSANPPAEPVATPSAKAATTSPAPLPPPEPTLGGEDGQALFEALPGKPSETHVQNSVMKTKRAKFACSRLEADAPGKSPKVKRAAAYDCLALAPATAESVYAFLSGPAMPKATPHGTALEKSGNVECTVVVPNGPGGGPGTASNCWACRSGTSYSCVNVGASASSPRPSR